MNTQTQNTLFSQLSDEWETPKAFFKLLDKEFNFNLDPCATDTNTKCERFFTREGGVRLDDNSIRHGLNASWGESTVFVNPPYSKVKLWLRKAIREVNKNNATVVFLLPSRTDTKWFHEFVTPYASEVRFVKGRLKFEYLDVEYPTAAPFPSVVVVFKRKYTNSTWGNVVATSTMPRSLAECETSMIKGDIS